MSATIINLKAFFGSVEIRRIVVPANDSDAETLFAFLLGSGFTAAPICEGSRVLFGIWYEFDNLDEITEELPMLPWTYNGAARNLSERPIVVMVPDDAETVEINL